MNIESISFVLMSGTVKVNRFSSLLLRSDCSDICKHSLWKNTAPSCESASEERANNVLMYFYEEAFQGD